MWQTWSYAQPQCKPQQHHGWISCRNAQDHLALGFRPHSTQLLPPAAARPSAMSAQCLLPSWRHGFATTNHSRTVWLNATGQRHLPPANDHCHASVSVHPRNDDECWTIPSGQQPMVAPMLMNHYAPTSSPTRCQDIFNKQGWVAIN